MVAILHLNKGYDPDIGGVEAVCKQYTVVSSDHFDRVCVMTLSDEFGLFPARSKIQNVEIIRYPTLFYVAGHRFSPLFFLNATISCFFEDVVHLHQPFPLGTLAVALSKPKNLILTYHADIVRQRFLKQIFDPLTAVVIKRADFLTTTSHAMVEKSDVLSKFKCRSVEVIPIWLDNIEKYSTRVPPHEISDGDVLDCVSGEPYILMLGRISYYKGLGSVEKALKLNDMKGIKNQLKLVVAGKIVDRMASEVSERIKLKYPNVVFIDKNISELEKLSLLQNCRALLFPSDKKAEAFGIVQLEALAARKPVVNVNLDTGVPLVSLDEVTGKTVALGDVEYFAKLFAQKEGVLSNLEALSKNIPSHLDRKFNKVELVAKLRAIYEACLEKNIE